MSETETVSQEQNDTKGLLALVEGIVLSDSEEEVEETEPEQTEKSNKPEDEKHLTSSDYYWNSYAHFGIHEVNTIHLYIS